MTRSITLLLTLAFAFTSCSFTKSGRQRRAYEKYVRKSSVVRVKQQSHFRSKKPQMPTSTIPDEPIKNSDSSPQAVPADG